MTNDTCGWPTAEGHGCTHPPTEDNGRCWQHADDAKAEGRPSKFTDMAAQRAIKAARSAKSIRGCARAAHVTHPTLGNWLAEDPSFVDEDGNERDFFTAFMRARAQGESLLVEGGLLREGVDSSHARFLLSTSFDYVEEKRVQVDEIDSAAGEEGLEEVRALVEGAYGNSDE